MAMGSEVQMDSYSRRLESIAVILFAVNAFVMIFYTSIYYDNELWAQTIIAVGTAASALLLISVLMSVLQLSQLAKYTLAAGILALVLAVISHGIRMIDYIGDHGGYY